MAVLFPSISSNQLGTSTGQALTQAAQEVHLSFTKRALLRTFTLKFPIYPSTFSTSERVKVWIFLRCPTETILGVRMQAEQSKVGKVLSNWAMCPPIDGSRSTSSTRGPASANSSPARLPV